MSFGQDIEGSEIDALNGGRLLASKRLTLLVELHSEEMVTRYDAMMAEFDYWRGKSISETSSCEPFVISKPR